MAYGQEKINPYHAGGEKREQVRAMFDGIAPAYDFLNHVLSLGTDMGWRRTGVDSLREYSPRSILDLACGTGDFTYLLARSLNPDEIIGCDLSDGMLQVARAKQSRQRLTASQLEHISFVKGDAQELQFADNRFDAVTIAYGVRNFQDLDAGLGEMYRVLGRGGHLLVLELATPPRFPMRQLFWLYSHIVMPAIGWIFSRDRKAYSYLPKTMAAFPQAEKMQEILERTGFVNVRFHRFTFGLCTMFLAEKPKQVI